MSRRGHALALMLASMAALSVISTVVATRLLVEVEGRRDEDVRAEALWLARSAAVSGRPGARAVTLSDGPAVVKVAARAGGQVEVEVHYSGAVARVQARRGPDGFEAWAERFERVVRARR